MKIVDLFVLYRRLDSILCERSAFEVQTVPEGS